MAKNGGGETSETLVRISLAKCGIERWEEKRTDPLEGSAGVKIQKKGKLLYIGIQNDFNGGGNEQFEMFQLPHAHLWMNFINLSTVLIMFVNVYSLTKSLTNLCLLDINDKNL